MRQTRTSDHLVRPFNSDLWHAATHDSPLRGFYEVLACNGRAVHGTAHAAPAYEATCALCRRGLVTGRIIDTYVPPTPTATTCVGCFQPTTRHAKGCPTGANGNPDYS